MQRIREMFYILLFNKKIICDSIEFLISHARLHFYCNLQLSCRFLFALLENGDGKNEFVPNINEILCLFSISNANHSACSRSVQYPQIELFYWTITIWLKGYMISCVCSLSNPPQMKAVILCILIVYLEVVTHFYRNKLILLFFRCIAEILVLPISLLCLFGLIGISGLFFPPIYEW